MKLSCFIDLRSLLVMCMICIATFSVCAQPNTENMEHDTVKARTYFEKGLLFKKKYVSDSSRFYLNASFELFASNSKWQEAISSKFQVCNVLYNDGRFDQSKESLLPAIELAETYLDDQDIVFSDLFRLLGLILLKEDRLDSSFLLLKKAFDQRVSLLEPNHTKIAKSAFTLGQYFLYRNQFDSAQKYFQTSLDIDIKNGNNLWSDYNAIGAIYYFKADYTKSNFYYQLGLKDHEEKQGNLRSVSSIYGNIGAIAFQQSDYRRAIEYYKKAQSIDEAYYPPHHYTHAINEFNLAEAFMELGDNETAIEYLYNSLEGYLDNFNEKNSNIIEIYEKMGEIFVKQGLYDSALLYYDRALQISTAVSEKSEFTASIFDQLGSVYSNIDKDSSYVFYSNSLSLYTEIHGAKHPKTAQSYLNFADLNQSMSNWTLTLEACEKALMAVLYNDLEVNHENIRFETKGIDVLSTYARYLTDAYLDDHGSIENLQKAMDYIEIAIELIQQKRILVFDQKAQQDFSERYVPVYEEGLRIASLLNEETGDKHYIETTFQMMEGSRAFTLNQSVQDREEPIDYSLPDSLSQLERSLKVDISFYEEEILNRRSNLNGYDTALVKNYEGVLFDRERDFDLLKQRLEKMYPKYHRFKYRNKTLNLSDLQQRLSENELLIEYLWQKDQVTMMGVAKHEIVYEEIPIDRAFLSQLEALNAAFDKPKANLSIGEFVEFSNSVFNKLVAPALAITGPKPSKLIVVADGPLTQLNFDLLVQDPSGSDVEWKNLPYLIKDYAIATGHSATLFFDEKSHVHNASNDLLAFSFGEEGESMDGAHLTMDVVRSADLTSLPGSAREIKTIADLLDGDYYFGQEANEQTFKEVASDYQILHLALHGSVDEENPDFSKLHLHSKDTTEDGQLHVFELYNMELNADLAVLSACNTGSGKYQMGEGIISLGHAFSYAGVNSLLLTRWDLSDEAAPEIMSIFYSELKKGKSKSEALRIAKLEYLENASIFRSNPFYWSSFYVLGNDSPVEFEKSNELNYALAGGFVLFLLAAFAFSRRRILS